MTIWTFNQAGIYPGAKDTFAGVRVEVDDATNEVVSVTPLTAHSEFEPATDASADAPTADIPATAPGEPMIEQSEAATPEHIQGSEE